MDDPRANILWIDDEIEHLKPHILFLEERGYSISISNNGKEGMTRVRIVILIWYY